LDEPAPYRNFRSRRLAVIASCHKPSFSLRFLFC
jgi:hypothetical protein